MARRQPPKKYTASGRLSAAWQSWRDADLNRRIKQTNKEIAAAKVRSEKREYAQRAKRLAKFVPSLKPLTTEKAITAKAKRQIKYRERQLKHAYNLRPVTPSQAKKLKSKLFAPGVQAIQLDNTATTSKIRMVGTAMFSVESNGREYLYIPSPSTNWGRKKDVMKAAQEAFEYPIEKVLRMAEAAFKKYKPRGISLWIPTGRQSQVFGDVEQFARFVTAHWQAGKYVTSPSPETGKRYSSDPNEWVRGIAVWIRGG